MKPEDIGCDAFGPGLMQNESIRGSTHLIMGSNLVMLGTDIGTDPTPASSFLGPVIT